MLGDCFSLFWLGDDFLRESILSLGDLINLALRLDYVSYFNSCSFNSLITICLVGDPSFDLQNLYTFALSTIGLL